MNRPSKKLRILFFPVTVATVVWLILFSFLHWAIIIKTGIPTIQQEIINIWASLLIPLVPVFTWLRPRMKLLLFPGKRGNPLYIYTLICSAAIGGPAIAAQYYLEAATGKLTALSGITALQTAPITKYYTIQDYFADKDSIKTWFASKIIGKGRGELALDMYCTIPLEDDAYEPVLIRAKNSEKPPVDTPAFLQTGDAIAKPRSFAWLCIHYVATIPNSKKDSIKIAGKKAFRDSCYRAFRAINFHSVIYFDRIGFTRERDGYLEAIYGEDFTENNIKNTILLESRFTTFEKRNGDYLSWMFISFGIGIGIWFVLIWLPGLDEEGLEKFYAEKR